MGLRFIGRFPFRVDVRLLRRVCMPLKILWVGHIYLIIYALGMCLGALWLLRQGLKVVSEHLLTLSYHFEIVSRYDRQIETIFTVAAILAFLPVLLTAIALPVRIIWLNHRLALSQILRETPLALLHCLRAIPLAVKQARTDLIPGVAMLLLYFVFVRHLETSNLYYLYTGACVIVGVLACYRALPVLIAPILAVAAFTSAVEAVANARQLLHRKQLALAMCMAGSGAIVVYLAIAGLGFFGVVILGVVVWYAVTLLTLLCMESMTEWVALQKNEVFPEDQRRANNPEVEIRRVWVR